MLDLNSATNGIKESIDSFHSSEKTYWPALKENIKDIITSKKNGNLIIRIFRNGNVVDLMIKPEDIVVCSTHIGMDTPLVIDTIEDSLKFISILLDIKIPDSNT